MSAQEFGGIVGGIVGTAVYGGACLLGASCTLGGAIGSIVGGAVGGACIGFTDALAITLCSAGAGAISTSLTELIDGDQISAPDIAAGAILGGVGGYIGGELFPTVGRLPSSLSNIWDPGLNSMRIYFESLVGAGISLLQPDGTKSGMECAPGVDKK